jgi:hypothetical protein
MPSVREPETLMKTLVIQLDRLEDIGSIRDKVTWGKSSRVLLVWPLNYVVFDRKVDLVTVKRICTSQGARLGIVCDDPTIIDEADELQIPVFSSVNQAMRKGWDRRKRKKTVIDHPGDDNNWLEMEDIRRRAGLASSSKTLKKPVRILLLVSGIFAMLLLALFLIPSAEVRVFPKSQTREMTVEFQVIRQDSGTSSPDVLSGKEISVTVEGQAERKSSGFLPVADAKARGNLTITNQTKDEITIPAHTIVLDRSNPPVRYQIMQDTKLPAEAATSSIPIEAIYGGEDGNADPGTITRIDGDFGLQLELFNPDQVTGGTNRNIPAPSTDDIVALRNDLRIKMEKIAETQLSSGLNNNEILLPASVQISDVLAETVAPEVGHAGSSVSLTQKSKFSAMVIDQKNLIEKAQTLLTANLVLPGWRVSESEPVNVQILSQKYDDITKTVKTTIFIKGKTIPIVDTESLRHQIVGKNGVDVERIIAGQVLSEKPVEIKSWPVALPILPLLESRIQVVTP